MLPGGQGADGGAGIIQGSGTKTQIPTAFQVPRETEIGIIIFCARNKPKIF
jgi:hypothetical protein